MEDIDTSVDIEFGTCPVCGSHDAMINTRPDGSRVRTCRHLNCPAFYKPIDASKNVKETLETVGYEVRSECGDSFYLVKDDCGYLMPKHEDSNA